MEATELDQTEPHPTARRSRLESDGADHKRRRAWLLFVALAVAVAITDQLTKAWIRGSFEAYVPHDLVGDWVRIQFIHNTGGLFGMFQSQSPVFALMTLIIAAVLVAIEYRAGWTSWWATLALGLLLGGAIGNWIDRVELGYVTDFVDMGIGTWRFYIYNVADSAVTVGIGVLLLLTFFAPKSLALDLGGDDDSKEAPGERLDEPAAPAERRP